MIDTGSILSDCSSSCPNASAYTLPVLNRIDLCIHGYIPCVASRAQLDETSRLKVVDSHEKLAD